MSAHSETAPFSRRSGSTVPKRPVMKLEWNKLLAEATEKDTEVGNEFGNAELEDDMPGYLEDDGTDTYKGEEAGEMPLNLCYKSNTMPSLMISDENTPNAMDLSAEKKALRPIFPKPNQAAMKQNACTLPNFQSINMNLNVNRNLSAHGSQLQSIVTPNKSININNNNNNNNNNSNIKSRSSNNNNNNMVNNMNNNNNQLPEARIPLIAKNLESAENIDNGGKQNIVYSIKFQAIDRKIQSCNTYEAPSASPGIFPDKETLKPCLIQPTIIKETRVSPDLESQNVQSHEHIKGPTPFADNKCNNIGERRVLNPTPIKHHSGQQKISNHHHASDRFAVPAVPAKVRESPKVLMVNGKSYEILALLGKGGSSKVFLVLGKESALLAVKCVRLSDVDESIKNNYLNEIQHLKKMQHSKHVIRLFDYQYVKARKILYAVMERGDTDLSKFLKDKASSDEGISPELIMYYWTEMLLAVKSIHDNNIIHRDLKPANFLLVSGRLKLIDFGIASSIQSEQTSVLMDTQSGTFNYMSPEALLDLGSGDETILKIGRKTDVWSLGCILYYFLYKKTPYQDFQKAQAKMRAITNPNYEVDFPKLPGVPQILIESCKRCLIHDKNKRASIEELLEYRNRPLLSPLEVLRKLKPILTVEDYAKAEKAIIEDEG